MIRKSRHPVEHTHAAAAGAADLHAAAGSTWVGVARRIVASYPDHPSAEKAVDRLAERQFPVERLAIVGDNPRLGQKATGRLGMGIVAGRAAVTGAIVGALSGWLLGVFDLMDPLVDGLWLAANGMIIGAVLGALLGLGGYAVTRGRRRFTPIDTFTADCYQILVDADLADQAAQILDGTMVGITDRDLTHRNRGIVW